MKNFLVLGLSLAFIAIGCKKSEEKTELFGFNEAQPTDVKQLQKIPDRLLGKYLKVSDSSVFEVGSVLIKRTSDFSGMIHIKKVDSVGSYNGHFIFPKHTNDKIPAERVGDNLRYHLFDTDTIFNLKSGDIVKKFKGYYFLNSLQDQSRWTVEKMRLEKGKIIINTIDSIQDFNKLRQIKENSIDTVAPHYLFRPTKKEFKSFVKSGGFGSNDRIYIKID